jgi:hypothetical protein
MFDDVQYHQEKYCYGFEISEELLACRNMASYHGLQDTPKEPVVFIVKALYINGTLAGYLKLNRISVKFVVECIKGFQLY